MSKALIVVAPHVATALQASVQLCSSIMEYRHATAQLELQHDTMHQQADYATLQENNQHQREMQKLRLLSEQCGATLTQNRKFSADCMTMWQQVNQQIAQLTVCLCDASLPCEHKQYVLQTISHLSEQQRFLLEKHTQLGQQPMTVLAQLRDGLHDGPRTFTDVS